MSPKKLVLHQYLSQFDILSYQLAEGSNWLPVNDIYSNVLVNEPTIHWDQHFAGSQCERLSTLAHFA